MKFFKNLLNSFGLFFHDQFSPIIILLFAVVCTGVVYIPLTFLIRDISILKNVPSPTLIRLEILFLILTIILGIGGYKSSSKRNPIILFRNKLRKAIQTISSLPDIHITDAEVSLLVNLKGRAQLKRTMQDVDKLLEVVDGQVKLVNLRKELQYLKDQQGMFRKLPGLIEEKQKELEKAEAKPLTNQ